MAIDVEAAVTDTYEKGSVYFVVKTALGADTKRKCQKAEKTMSSYPSIRKS